VSTEDGEIEGWKMKFLLQALVVAFGCWAGVVAWGVDRITNEMAEIADRQMSFADKFGDYVTATERRITRLEELSKKAEKDHTYE
jgi:hypothetical protein